MLTLSVCDGTSCDVDDTAAVAEFPAESISAVLSVDKKYIGGFVGDDDISLVGAGGISNSPFSSTEDQAVISQFNLESGSVASFLGAALVTAIAPFVATYIFLALHQAWLRQRVTETPPLSAAAAADEEPLEAKVDRCSGWMNSDGARRLWLALLAGLAMAAFVVSFPIVAFGDGEPEILPGFAEEITSACPGCINGVTTAEYLDAAPIASASRIVRATLMTKAVRVSRRRGTARIERAIGKHWEEKRAITFLSAILYHRQIWKACSHRGLGFSHQRLLRRETRVLEADGGWNFRCIALKAVVIAVVPRALQAGYASEKIFLTAGEHQRSPTHYVRHIADNVSFYAQLFRSFGARRFPRHNRADTATAGLAPLCPSGCPDHDPPQRASVRCG